MAVVSGVTPPAGLWLLTVDSAVSVGSRYEEEASAGVQLHPARQRLPAPLPAEHRRLLRKVSPEKMLKSTLFVSSEKKNKYNEQ